MTDKSSGIPALLPPRFASRLRPGVETRYVFGLYLQRVGLFTLITLIAILALEAASNLDAVYSTRAVASGVDGPLRLLYFVSLRAGYDLPLVLPIGALMGVVWAEHSLAATRQRIMMFNAGRSPLRSLTAAALLALTLAPIQFTALAYVRPATVELLATAKLRGYGPRFDAPSVSSPQWVATSNALIRFRVDFTDLVTLRDMLFFEVDGRGAPHTLLAARTARPADTPGSWVLGEASRWRPSLADGTHWQMDAERVDDLHLPLPLDPVWTANVGIQPSLLGQRVLMELASTKQGVPLASAYRAVEQERFAAPVYLLGLTLLAATLSMRWFQTERRAFAFLWIGSIGIGIYFVSSTLSSIGSYGLLPALVSAWLVPVALVGVALFIALRSGPGRVQSHQEQVPGRSGTGRRQ